MKTSDAIKKLEDNPKLVFETTDKYGDKHQLSVNPNGYLIYSKFLKNGQFLDPLTHSGGNINGNIKIADYDWQLVRTPVPWQEAIQAWLDGKEIEICECAGGCIHPACVLREKFTAKSNPDKPQDGFAICRQQFNTATWYIND